MNLRSSLCNVLKRRSKKSFIYNIIGCDINYLIKHYENLFEPNMNWENHGVVWETDHIVPCCSFDLTDIQQQKVCFHYSNLRPLLISENQAKGSKILYKEVSS